MQEVHCFKYTSDDWYPNFYKHTVLVSYSPGDGGDDPSVGCSGADDLDYSYFGPDAEYIFMRILEMGDVTRDKVKALGLTAD